jgi:hypothetical protein
MKNKNFMIFQTAVRKYEGIYEKKLKWLFFWFLPTEFNKKIRKILDQKM